jgi:hypothetical protein
MNNVQISKLIDNLKSKIKKLEYRKIKNLTEIMTWRIEVPTNNLSKKYVGFLFNNNFSDTIDNSSSISFIKLPRANYIINYSITLKVEMNNSSNEDDICTFSLGIRDSNNKIKIIKGSKTQSKISSDCVNGTIIINNTILYEVPELQELCLIGKFSNKCSLVSKKSIIKIL